MNKTELSLEINLAYQVLTLGNDIVYRHVITRDLFSIDTCKEIYDCVTNGEDQSYIRNTKQDLYKKFSQLTKGIEIESWKPATSFVKELKEVRKQNHFKKLGERLANGDEKALSQIIKDAYILETDQKRPTDMKSILNDCMEERAVREYGKLTGYDTGITRLNKLTDGVRKGMLWIIGAYTSYGKSMLAIQLCNNILKYNAHVLFFSLEMGSKQIANRLLANISQQNVENFIYSDRGNTETQMAYDLLNKKNLEIFDSVRNYPDVMNIVKARKSQNKCDVVIIDYIQNFSTKGYKTKLEMLQEVSHGLQTIAIKEDVAVICLSQVNRDSVKNKSEAFGFKGAGDIEESGDVCISIERTKINGEFTEEFKLNVSKNRHGSTGIVECAIKPEKCSIYQIIHHDATYIDNTSTNKNMYN